MPETAAAPPDEQPHTFNPDLPKLFANYVKWWDTVLEEKDQTFPVFEFFLPLDDEQPYPALPAAYANCWHTITSGSLLELVRRDAYAEKTRRELAEACARLRQERDDALAELDQRAPRPYDVDELPPGVTCAIGLPGALTPAEIDELTPLREMLEQRAAIRAKAAGIVETAVQQLADAGINQRPVRAELQKAYGLHVLGALISAHLVEAQHADLMRRAFGDDGAKRVLDALRSEAVRVVAEQLTAQACAAPQAGATLLPPGIDLRQQCTRCGQQPGRYATGCGLLCEACRGDLYPSDAVPAGGDAS